MCHTPALLPDDENTAKDDVASEALQADEDDAVSKQSCTAKHSQASLPYLASWMARAPDHAMLSVEGRCLLARIARL